MNILWKCCIRSLKENRSRTIVTILGVALATALITAVGCMGTSFLKSEADYLKQKNDWHACFTAVAKEDLKYFENNQSLESVRYVKRNGYGRILMDASKPCYLEMLAPEEDFYQCQKITLLKGRLPEKEGEIIVGKDLRTECGYEVKLGDVIEVEIGDRTLHGQLLEVGTSYIYGNKDPEDNETLTVRETKKFQIVGIFQGGYANFLMARRSGTTKSLMKAYYYDENPGVYYDVYVRYTKQALSSEEEVASGILGISPQLFRRVFVDGKYVKEEEILQATKRAKNYDFNRELAAMEYPVLLLRDYYGMLGLVGLVYLIVVYAGVFCINNSFDLSFTERIRFYGMLASVGTTKRQKRKIVWMEAVFIGGIGIPLGIVLGCLITASLVGFVNLALSVLRRDLDFHFKFQASLFGILLSIFVSAVMIFLSAFESAARASKVTPISAIRMNDLIKSEERKLVGKKDEKQGKRQKQKKAQGVRKTAGVFRSLLGPCGNIAFQNYRRARIKYRATITTIVVSVALLIGLSFVEFLFDIYEEERYLRGGDPYWQIQVSSYQGADLKEVRKIEELPGVRKSLFQVMTWLQVAQESIPYIEGMKLERANQLQVIVLDEGTFAELCKMAKVDPEEAKGKGIVDSSVIQRIYENGLAKGEKLLAKTADFQNVKEIPAQFIRPIKETKEFEIMDITLEIAGQLDQAQLHQFNERWNVTVYVDWSFLEAHPECTYVYFYGCFLCDDAIALENEIEDMELSECYVINVDQDLKSNQFTKILVLSLMGGFITVIFLIGVTNVVNAISTNMELRAPEYAKLIAIGMTGKQFKGMLHAEGMIIAGKGLSLGLLIGYGISYALYRFFWEVDNKQFTFGWRIPVWETVAAIFAVAIMMWFVLKYGRKKLQKKNLIETIRGENI